MNGPDNTDPLAGRTFTPLIAPAPEDPEADAQAAQAQAAADEAVRALRDNAAALIMGGLKLLRKVVAKRLPEILDEWPDSMLEAPAKAAVPLVEAHIDRLMAAVSADPKLVVFVLACLPMGMGYMVAMDRHQRTIDMPAGDGGAAA